MPFKFKIYKTNLFLLVMFLLSSCSGLTVYKITQCDTPGLNEVFFNDEFLIREHSECDNKFLAREIKQKIGLYLKSKGYNISYEIENKLPRFIMLFIYNTEKESKHGKVSIYEPGKTIYSSGNIYGYNGTSYSYCQSSTESGAIKSIPYAYNVYNANLKIFIYDTEKEVNNPSSPSNVVWSASSFFWGNEASDIDEAINYLIITVFDRFGYPAEGAADEYKFSGKENELELIKSFNNRTNKIIKRRVY